MKYYCQTIDCKNEIPEPEMCCSGHECGCMGQPIEPPYCDECWDKIQKRSDSRQSIRDEHEKAKLKSEIKSMFKECSQHLRGEVMPLEKRTIRVATFYHEDDTLCKSHIQAYTGFWSPSWDGCIEYLVEATNGREAKRIAVHWRLRYERLLIAKANFYISPLGIPFDAPPTRGGCNAIPPTPAAKKKLNELGFKPYGDPVECDDCNKPKYGTPPLAGVIKILKEMKR